MIRSIQILIAISCFAFSTNLVAQSFNTSTTGNVEFDKNNFSKDQRSEFKEAKKALDEADEYFSYGRGAYRNALKNYLVANKFNSNNAHVNYRIGRCYLKGTIYKLKSISYFLKAYSLNPHVDPEVQYYLGQAYQINSDWDKAIESYNKYKSHMTGAEPPTRMNMVNKKITECGIGKELMANPTRAFIDNVGMTINGKYPEYGAVITPDEGIMVFTSRRPGTTGGSIDPGIGQHMEDIYMSKNIRGKWSEPENMGKPINSNEHDAVINLSPDGQTLLVYQDDKGDGNIYECKLKGEEWSRPKKLGKNINTKQHEPSACYSYDGQMLYFVSAREEGNQGVEGTMDIYMSRWDAEKEKWGEAYNLGPLINTPYNEDGVFMHPDGKSLYFSSKGHNTMGGYDIFKSTFENGKWTTPVNIGYPINTPGDDVFFVLSGSGKHGYYSSYKTDGFGEKDIYKITFLGPEKPVMLNTEDNLLASVEKPVKEAAIEPVVEISRNRVTILKGTVTDRETGDPLESALELIDNSDGNIISNFNSNSATGKYLVSLPSGKNYGLAVKAEGYLFHSENFNIPAEAAFMEVIKNVKLNKIKVGEKIILRNIFFDYGKYTLRAESTFELGRIFKVMKDNPSIRVEISGHTDSRGSVSLNQKLSENRAKSVVDFLIKQGISADRLIYKGYGKEQPVATNDTEEGRQENRRTEFKILEK